jgi:SAM-dependent methyltransferase
MSPRPSPSARPASPMDAADIAWLQTPGAAPLIEETARSLDAGATELRVLDTLRAQTDPARARAILALLEGRRVAAAKFEDAASLTFDRSSAEQATPEAVSHHIAARFHGVRHIADLGCGAGADSLALAIHAPVVAVDRDAARLAMARANARVRDIEDRIETVEGDLTRFALPADIDAVWLDPGRRDERGRVLDPRRWTPPLEVALTIARTVGRAGIKVAPGIDLRHVPEDGEIEFISLRGDLVVAVIWLGSAVTTPRRATVLPSGDTLAASDTDREAEVHSPGRYLYDPDPAIGRARLVGSLAHRLDAWQLDGTIAYLSSDEPRDTPFARRFRIEAVLPFAERRLLETLRDLDAARVEVMRRGSPVDTNALERRLNHAIDGTDGTRVRTVALTRVQGEQVAIVCERER